MNRWLPAPHAMPRLGDAAHVWAVNLDDASFNGALWRGRLSPEEQGRADRFKFARDQRRYIIAHAALRDILAGYANAGPAALQFNEGPNGKPKLLQPFDAKRIEFNLSHSHETALIAVNCGSEVGVDIEFARADFQFLDVASHFFTTREVNALHGLPAALQRQAFYKCWTSKEAFLKAKGTGLSGALDEVEILLVGDGIQIQTSVAGWSLLELAPGAGYEAALVTGSKPREVRCYRWQAPW
jgi:4'-phosphopantetheinyl transferase